MFKKESSILTIFLIFFIGYSLISIYLSIITKSINTEYGIYNVLLNLFQIGSLLLILFNYKKKLGFYIFFIIRFLNIILAVIINSSIQNIFISFLNNIIILVVFYIFYYNKSEY